MYRRIVSKVISISKAPFAAVILTVGFMVPVSSVSAGTLSSPVDVAIGDSVIYTQTLTPQDNAELIVTALEDARITGFSVTGTGDSADLDLLLFGFDSPPTSSFSSISGTSGSGSLPGLEFSAGERFVIYFDFSSAPSGNVVVSANFAVVAPLAPIPLPAGGLLLLTGLCGLSISLRRKKASA